AGRMREGEAGGESAFHRLDREDLVAGRPDDAAQHAAGAEIDGMNAGLAAVGVQPRRVAAVLRDDPARADERDVAAEAEAARPAGEADHRLESPVHHTSQLAVAAVIEPQLLAAQPGRM